MTIKVSIEVSAELGPGQLQHMIRNMARSDKVC